MTAVRPSHGIIWEGTSPTLMARVLNSSGNPISQAGTTSVAYSIFDTSRASKVIGSGTRTVGAVIYDTYQDDDAWSVDSIGYNFRDTPAASNFPIGGRTYRVEYKITPSSGDPYYVVFEVTTRKIYTE